MIGKQISHYRVLEKLGEGGMGVVYKAEDLKLGRTVALKFLAAHLLQNEEARKRFVREARAVAALDHPNICTLYEIDEADGGAFMAMACLEGRTLEAEIAEGPLSLLLALDIAKQVAKGLEEAHNRGILHRDIKPSNIYLVRTGSKDLLAKILDFGLARALGQTQLTRHDSTVGTVAYMSPEQTQDSGVDHRTDIWALGVVLYEMLTGLRPFRGAYENAVIYSITCEEPEPLTSLRTGTPMQLEWVIDKALAKDPASRYQSCVELLVDLDAVSRRLDQGTARTAATGIRSVPLRPTPTASESERSSPKQRARDTVLQLGSQGVLPDRILSQTLETLAAPESESSDEVRARRRLLDDLAESRVRVGEFIEQWHDLDTRQADATGGRKGGKKKRAPQDERSKAEVFGLPLFRRYSGKDPATGRERISAGVVAIGNISVGVVAIGKWLAIGAVAISPVSIGLWALGLVALGWKGVGVVPLSLGDLPWHQALIVVAGLAAAAALLRYYRKRSLG